MKRKIGKISTIFALLFLLCVSIFTLTACGDNDGEHIHIPNSAVIEKEIAATCSSLGSYDEVVYCTECSEEISRTTKTTEKLSHTPSEWITDTEATCKVEGTKYKECTKCEEVLETGTIDKLTTHTPGEAKTENFVDSDCETEGSYNLVTYCSVCDTKLTTESKNVEKKPHTSSDWIIDKEATCREAGSKHKECTKCEEVLETGTIDKLTTHTPGGAKTEDFVDSDCETEGSYNLVVYCSVCEAKISTEAKTVEKKPHTASNWITDKNATCKEAGSKHKECTKCEEVLETTVIDKLTTHTPASAIIENKIDSTCSERGSYDEVVKCSVCGIELSREEKEIGKLPHTETIDIAVEPTCTETGLTAGKHCSVCNEVIVAQEIVKANGHKDENTDYTCDICTTDLCTEHEEEIIPSVSATCTETGLTEGKKCSICGDILVAQEIVKANGHTEVIDKAKAPTCTETGLTEGKHCLVCSTVLVAQEVVKANGHTEVIDKAKAPTCTETGLTEGKHCSLCSTVLVAQEVVKANGHTEGEWIIDVEPTIYEPGSKHTECEICQEVLEVDVVEILASYTVTFKQNGEDDIVVRVVTNGTLTDIPTPEERTGYTVKWDITDFSKITDNLVVSAIETPIEYTITYVLSYGSVPIENPDTYTIETELTALLNPQSAFGITFAGWFTSPDFTTTTAITHVAGGMIGDITVYGQFAFYRVESVTGFEIDYSAGTPQIKATVSNETFEIDMKPLIEVSSGCTYKIYEDKYGKFSYDFGILPLGLGDNVFYLSVYHPNSSVYYTLYELHIYRLDIKEYAFMNDGFVWESGEIEELSSLEAPEAPKKIGYTFDGWTIDGELVSFPYTVNVDTVFVAKYTPIVYNITYELNGGTLETEKNSYTIEETLTFDEPNRYAYSFEGWYLDEECTLSYNAIILGIYGDIKVYAKWSPIVCDIIYNLDGGINGEGNPAHYTVESDDITLAEPTKVGYTFLGWTYHGQNNPTKTVTIHNGSYGNKEFTANWQANTYTITFLTKNGEPTYESLTVTYDRPFTLPESRKEYYQLVWLNGDAEFIDGIWNIASDVTLTAKYISIFTVSGNAITGMTDYGKENYTEIVIPEEIDGVSITEIGANAFKDCSDLVSATISDGITIIGDYAFIDSTSLKNITIGNAVRYIGSYAFYGCKSITSLNIPESVTDIGFYAFYNCKKLIEVINCSSLNIEVGSNYNGYSGYYAIEVHTGESKIVNYNDYLFYTFEDVNYLFDYVGGDIALVLPEDYNGEKYEIYKCAFYDSTSITSVTIPDSVTSIGSSAFENCDKLVEVINNSSLKITAGSYSYGYAGYYAKEVHTGESKVVNYNDYLFYTYNDTNYLLGYIGTDTELTLPDNYNGEKYEIYKYAFYECTSLTSITISNRVTSIGSSAFEGCTSLIEIYFNAIAMNDLSDSNNVFCNVGKNGNLIKVVIGKNVTKIPAHLFFSNYSNPPKISSIEFEKGCVCESIGSYAFAFCKNLTSIIIPDNTSSIGDHAFYACSGLISLNISDGVTHIGDYAFYDCEKLFDVINCSALNIKVGSNNYGYAGYYAKEVHTGESKVVNYNNYLFYTYKGINYLLGYVGNDKVLVLPEYYNGEKYKIYDDAFYNRDDLTSIVISNNVTSIGNWAFAYCTNLTSVRIGNSVTNIGVYAFSNCDSLTSVVFDNPSGWHGSTSTSEISFSSASLSNESTSATYLKSTWSDYYWKRI